ncbi:hypothetical protein FHP25_00955 [Vineibacter terrae]|uniref:SPW repeat-containing integral membrane domain-containing protein n=1 Tax=Vineibacter terrae TaxID=2586908 RepID=A0A5C8PVG2_9HYPH|nr:SPW repeat protein [Vineibacter terrae]TXL82298.1 hypothetical protein FHP25_00955 [Vineibacter terrae]
MVTMRMLGTHRAWEDWAMVAFGALIVVSPWLMPGETGHVQSVVLNAVIVGLIVCALAALEMLALERWEEATGFVCGIWMIASPFVFDYADAGMLRYWHFALGALVAIFAAMEFWQDTTRAETAAKS